jgi:methylenetetrahydrofolate--tRNA-(uracil-5-)-methyltransferase
LTERLTIVGGGLAGCEAAWRAAAHGLKATLMEMRPDKTTPAHQTGYLAELVCSNSLRSDSPKNAVGLLKEELRSLGSIVMRAADLTKVPAGRALAVDRTLFAKEITRLIEEHPLIEVVRSEFKPPVDAEKPLIIAAGPLAAGPLAEELAKIAGEQSLHFYDAIAPVVAADSLDLELLFKANRHGEEEGGDYLNAPFEKDRFELFVSALLEADRSEPRPFEDKKHFEGCLPIEVMAERGIRTLAFGPMRPVGLINPATGKKPYAVVQLRQENLQADHYNLVGFQTRLTRGAQEKVLRLIPGLEKAKFARYGSIHRNTFLAAPETLDQFSRLKRAPNLFAAGQISGVEGYVESAAHGLWAGENAARLLKGLPLASPPRETALGSLLWHLRGENLGKGGFSPSNITFGLFPPQEESVPKSQRAAKRLEAARSALRPFLAAIGYPPAP